MALAGEDAELSQFGGGARSMSVIMLFPKALAVALGVSFGVWAVTAFNEHVFEPWVKCCQERAERRRRGYR